MYPEGVWPPAQIPRVELLKDAWAYPDVVLSPKSIAFPPAAIVIYSISLNKYKLYNYIYINLNLLN